MKTRAAAVLLAALVAASPARAVPAVELRAQDLDIPLMIQTVPALPSASFTLGARRFTADANGLALITVDSSGDYVLEVERPAGLPAGARPAFVRWSDGSERERRSVSIESFTFLEAGFEISHPVTPRFVDDRGEAVATEAIKAMTVVDGDGTATRWTPGGPLLLKESAIVVTDEGLEAETIGYAVDSIGLEDQRIPGPAQAPFFAGPEQRVWTVEIALHDLRIVTIDALLRRPVGGAVVLGYPDGRRRTVRPDRSGDVRAGSLPPGTYSVEPNAGVALGGLATVPADAEVRVPVVTATDGVILAAVAVTVLLIAVLARARRPRGARAREIGIAERAPEGPGPPPRGGPGPPPPRPAPAPPVEREHVRVRMVQGRTIEGWRRRGPGPHEQPVVWVLDVERVFDADGREVTSIPRDSFLVAAHIVEVEPLSDDEAGRVIRLDEARGEAPSRPERAPDAPGPTTSS